MIVDYQPALPGSQSTAGLSSLMALPVARHFPCNANCSTVHMLRP